MYNVVNACGIVVLLIFVESLSYGHYRSVVIKTSVICLLNAYFKHLKNGVDIFDMYDDIDINVL